MGAASSKVDSKTVLNNLNKDLQEINGSCTNFSGAIKIEPMDPEFCKELARKEGRSTHIIEQTCKVDIQSTLNSMAKRVVDTAKDIKSNAKAGLFTGSKQELVDWVIQNEENIIQNSTTAPSINYQESIKIADCGILEFRQIGDVKIKSQIAALSEIQSKLDAISSGKSEGFDLAKVLLYASIFAAIILIGIIVLKKP